MSNAVRTGRFRRWVAGLAALLLGASSAGWGAQPAAAAGKTPISGAGSTWSYNAIHAWQGNMTQYQIVVNYAPVGSTTGRADFKQGTVDWAASDIPYGVKDGTSEDPPPNQRGFAYMPVTAGGTVFMYNLKIGTKRVTNLRLSGSVVSRIFTGVITKWNDPAIKADNPGLTLPALDVVPVVRSDGSGSTAQFTQWMVATQTSTWNTYCQRVNRNPCTQTSAYPVLNGSKMVGQAGDLGVAGYVSQAAAIGTIGYVEYSYAIQAGFPVAKVLNRAGYYTEPTPGHVAVALLKAQINPDKSNLATYLTQDLSGVYANTDPRTYELSSYSYMILPTTTDFNFNANKGFTLGEFGKYVLCQGQTQVDALGYSALPINLVEAGYEQLAHIPGANIPTAIKDIVKGCNNPTFSTDGSNTLATHDPQPAACDHIGPTQCTTGTGGATNPTGNSGSGNGGAGGSGTGGTGNTNGGTGGVPTTGPSGAVNSPGGVVDPTATGSTCDADTGACDPGAAPGASQDVSGIPVDASADLTNTTGAILMVVAALLLISLALAPPLLGRASANRRARRMRMGDE